MVEIRRVDASSVTDSELGAITELRRALDAELAPDDPPATEEWMRSELHPGMEFVSWHHLVARDCGEPVAIAELELVSVEQNRHLAEADIEVRPDRRREGIGSALVAAIAEICRAEGRSLLVGYGPTGGPAESFWPRFGLEFVYQERISRLAVADVDTELMASWVADAATAATGHRLVRWEGPAPDEWAAPMQRARDAMNDAPTGDLDIEDYHFDEAWLRSVERMQIERGRRLLTFLCVEDATGEVAGLTELMLEVLRPWHAWQGDTFVTAAHRGKGIGRWLKGAMWQWVGDLAPELRQISTYNAAANEHMLAINVAMGFRPWRDYSGFQGPIP